MAHDIDIFQTIIYCDIKQNNIPKYLPKKTLLFIPSYVFSVFKFIRVRLGVIPCASSSNSSQS